MTKSYSIRVNTIVINKVVKERFDILTCEAEHNSDFTFTVFDFDRIVGDARYCRIGYDGKYWRVIAIDDADD